jgi:hypothetical protein
MMREVATAGSRSRLLGSLQSEDPAKSESFLSEVYDA